MPNVKSFNDYMIDLVELHDGRVARLEKHRPVFPIADQIVNLWSLVENLADRDSAIKRHGGVRYSSASSYGVEADLYLAPDDTLGDLAVFIDEYVTDLPDLIFIEQHQYDEGGWVRWTYSLGPNGPRLSVFGFVNASNHCHYVGTGKMTGEMKIICDEMG